MRPFTITLLLAAQCLSLPLAHADSTSKSPLYVDVQYADLDLARIEGAAALYTRLRAAARQVCTPLESRQLERARQHGVCVADALATAVAKVDKPLLTAYYEAKLEGRHAASPQLAKR